MLRISTQDNYLSTFNSVPYVTLSTPQLSGFVISSKTFRAKSTSPQWTQASITAFITMVFSFPCLLLAISISSKIWSSCLLRVSWTIREVRRLRFGLWERFWGTSEESFLGKRHRIGADEGKEERSPEERARVPWEDERAWTCCIVVDAALHHSEWIMRESIWLHGAFHDSKILFYPAICSHFPFLPLLLFKISN